jgi:hypothetical protein
MVSVGEFGGGGVASKLSHSPGMKQESALFLVSQSFILVLFFSDCLV